MINEGAGQQGSFSPDLTVNSDQKVVGAFHTHPYDKTEGGHTGVSLSGGDAAYMINNNQNIVIAQSGDEQFMYMRTASTPTNVDFTALDDAQNARVYELSRAGHDLSTASKIAAKEAAEKNGLAYYEGRDGKFSRVSP
jgi:type VI secretion system secreted protein VgrG